MSDQLSLDSSSDTNPRLRLDAPAGRQHGGAAFGHAIEDGPGAGDQDPQNYLKIVYKRRWTVIAAFVLIVGGVGVHTFTATPIYEARARLLMESDEKNVVSFKPVVEENAGAADFYQTQSNILQSRALARKTLDALKLWDTPPFGGKMPQKFSLTRAVINVPAAVADAVGSLAGGGKAPSSPHSTVEANETAAQSRAIDVFLNGLDVTLVKSSRLVDVTYRSPDPLLATQLVNALTKTYIEQNLEYKFMASKEASGWLGERLAEQRKEVEQAEAALQRYREVNDAIALEDRQNIVDQKLGDLNAALTRAKLDRITKEGVYTQLREGQSDKDTLDSFPLILSNSLIQQQRTELANLNAQHAQLSQTLGDKHPQMVLLQTQIRTAQAKLQGEIQKVVQSVRTEYQTAVAQENSLTAALNQQKAEAQSMNRKAIDYGVLLRDVQSTKQIYESLLQRAKETGVSSELRTSSIRIVDPAERPRSPASPKRGQNMLLATGGGLLLSLGLAFLFEFLDNRIKRPNEIRTHLGIPSLGFLPLLPAKAREGHPLINNGVPPNFTEAFRTIRTNVVFASADEGPRSIVVTSTSPGEGKTVVATNLALSLAQAGQRVLLIDADMRKPKVHDVFKMKQEPGLSNLMVGNVKANEAVRKSDVAGLWVLTGGRLPPNPAELLGSRRFRDLLSSLSTHFEWIVIDSPPVMAVTDASVVAHVASGVLFVIRADATSRHTAQTALEQLDGARAKFYGGILNGIDIERNGFYYANYYRKEYGQYYTTTSAQ